MSKERQATAAEFMGLKPYPERDAPATPKPRAGEHVPRFPVGGSKSAVYNFLRDRGFVMTHWSDKHWTRADGLHLHIYGTGSRARIYGKDDSLLADDALDAAVVLVALPSANGR